MTTIKLWLSTFRSTLTSVAAFLVFALLYAILLATFFKFVWTREATVWQVFLTYSFMVLIPFEFYFFQAAIIDRVRQRRFAWLAIFVDALKFFVATIPVLLLGWLVYYLLHKLQLRYPAPPVPNWPAGVAPPAQPTHWPSLIFATLKFFLLGVLLPLTAIHLWISIAGGEVRGLFAGGASSLFKRIGRALAAAVAFDSVLIYGIGLLLFFVIPYAVLFVPFNPGGNKTDFAVFVLRLFLSFLFSLIGWVVTISALTRNSIETAPAVPPDRSPAVAAEAAA